MKKNSQFCRIISLLLIFSMLIQLTSCYSSRFISLSEISGDRNYCYILHGRNSTTRIDNVRIENDILSGKMTYQKQSKKRFDVYLLTDSAMQINITDQTIIVPVSAIGKIKFRKIDELGTTIAIAGAVATTIVIISAVSFIHSDFGLHNLFQGGHP